MQHDDHVVFATLESVRRVDDDFGGVDARASAVAVDGKSNRGALAAVSGADGDPVDGERSRRGRPDVVMDFDVGGEPGHQRRDRLDGLSIRVVVSSSSSSRL